MTAKAQGLVAKVRGLAVKGLLGRDAAFALVFVAIVSLVASAALGLAKLVDPALAALIIGIGLTLLLILAAWLAGRAPKSWQPSDSK